MIRDNAEVVMAKNRIHENYYQLSIRNMGKGKRTKDLLNSNTIDGPSEIPNPY